MKKWIALVLCLLFCIGTAQAAVSVRTDAGSALLDCDGGEIIAIGSYDDIVALGDGMFAGEQNGLYTLIQSQGVPLTDPIYQELRLQGDFLLAKQGGLWGMLNLDGTPRSDFIYTLILPDGSGECWALKGNANDNESDLVYLLDEAGRETETAVYARDLSREPAEGLLAVLQPDGRLWGYCDSKGKMAIPAAFEYAGDFVNGRAAVVSGGKYGCIDRSGAFVIPAEHDFLEISEAGFIIAAQNMKGVQVFDFDGNETAAAGGEDVYIARIGSGYGVVDMEKLRVYDGTGRLLLEAESTAMVTEGVGERLIVSDGAWGEACVYLNGSDAKYQNLHPLGTADGEAIYAYLTVNVGRYVNDLLGEIQYSADMDTVRYGVVDANGEILLESRYHSVEYLEDDRLLVRTDEAWQMIDSHGTVYWSLSAPMQIEGPSF